MVPSTCLLSDLARLLGLLTAPRRPTVLTDRERLDLATLQSRLMIRRCALGLYAPIPGLRGGPTPSGVTPDPTGSQAFTREPIHAS